MKKYLTLALSLILLSVVGADLWGQIPNVRISTPSFQLQNEEQVFYCPTDGQFIIANWRDFRLGYRRCGVGRSTNGGLTWTDQLNEVMVDPGNWQSDPTMTVDRLGNFYCCYLDFSPTFPTSNPDSSFVIFTKSTDKGATWTGPYQVVPRMGRGSRTSSSLRLIAPAECMTGMSMSAGHGFPTQPAFNSLAQSMAA